MFVRTELVNGKSVMNPVSREDEGRLVSWRKSTFWVCLVGYIGYYLVRANLSAAFPLMGEVFHYSNTELGMIAAYSEGAYALGKFINGPLADKFGGHKIFVAGMVGGIVFNYLFAMSSSLVMFIIFWCLCRYFLSAGWGGLVKMIGNWYPPEKNGTVMGLISVNFQFGGVLGTLLAGYILFLGLGWRGVFIWPATLVVLIAIWSYFASKERPSDIVAGAHVDRSRGAKLIGVNELEIGEQVSIRKLITSMMSLRLFQLLLSYAVIMQAMRSFFLIWTAKFLVDIGMGQSNAIFNSALFPFFGALGTILLGWYTDKFGVNGDRARPLWKMLIALAICLYAIAAIINVKTNGTAHGPLTGLEPQFPLILVLLSLSGFLVLAPYSMSAGALSLDIAGPQGAATSAGILDGFGYAAGGLATWAAGYISDRSGWFGVFQFMAIAALFAAFAAYMMSRGFRRAAAVAESKI